jgi:multimeric flavodoxin WrbA
MKLIIHDLLGEEAMLPALLPSDNRQVISDNGRIKPCIGCFGCWTKTPGECLIRNDGYNCIGRQLGHCDELWVISECFYGAYSPFVKNVFDRSIGYLLPFFRIKNGEMHHIIRYDKRFTIKVFFYGENITPEEQATARGILHGNFINLDCQPDDILFFNSKEELKGALQ